MLLVRKIVLIFMILVDICYAEPWLANKFAQNCAGCHSPSRANLEAKDRRCTLSCQGCHVNPQGGGMRSFYGKWTENYFLKSFKIDRKRDYPVNAPLNPMVTVENNYITDQYYSRDGFEYTIVDQETFRSLIPYQDPFWQTRRSKLDLGLDIRWQNNSGEQTVESSEGPSTREIAHNFLMAVNLGLRYRPFYTGLAIVAELQYLGNPREKRLYDIETPYRSRDLYILLDNLPFNTFLQYGMYRPQFLDLGSDHTRLSNRIVSQLTSGQPATFRSSWEAISIGGSPNVPFYNFSVITKRREGDQFTQQNGFVANVGGRFVTAGLSLNLSYWKTDRRELRENAQTDSQFTSTELVGVSLGASFGIWTPTLRLMTFESIKAKDFFTRGSLYEMENHIALFRHIYAYIGLTTTDQYLGQTQGFMNQKSVGLKVFLNSGAELQIIYETEESSDQGDSYENNVRYDSSIIKSQLHFFL